MARLLDVAMQGADLIPKLRQRRLAYTRTCAYADQRFEVLLLDWSAGASSAIHDHGGQHCWFVVLNGRLRVDDFVRTDAADVPGCAAIAPLRSQQLDAGDLDVRSGRFDLHRVSAGDRGAVSLHVYAGPLLGYQIYDEHRQRCQVVRATYDDRLSLFDPGVPAR